MPSFNTGLTFTNTYKIDHKYEELFINFYCSINLKDKYGFVIQKGIDINIGNFKNIKCNCVSINAEYFNITNNRTIIFKDINYSTIATYEISHSKLLIICVYNKGFLNFRTIGGKLYTESRNNQCIELA